MIGRSHHIVMAVILGVGFVGCGGGSQSGLDPSASGQTSQQPTRSSSAHKATVGFTWTHNRVDIPAGQTIDEATECNSGETVINGTYRKKGIGDDITVIQSFPVTNFSWQISATNNGKHQEYIVAYLLCAAGS